MLDLELDNRGDPLELARALGLRCEIGEQLSRVCVSAAHRELGQHRSSQQLLHTDRLLGRTPRCELRGLPLALPQVAARRAPSTHTRRGCAPRAPVRTRSHWATIVLRLRCPAPSTSACSRG